MTPKKNIIREPTRTLPDGTALDLSGLYGDFTEREALFIAWYTHPGTEAFMNAGRAAVRAGYKQGNAVAQGYLLRRKPRIAEKIESRLQPVADRLHETLWRIWDTARIRAFWTITDFYRSVYHTEKTGVRHTIEAIPLDELEYKQRICIDGIEFMGPENWVSYKLPDRDKAFRQFLQCSMLLAPDVFQENRLLMALAPIYKVKLPGKGLKGMAAYMRETPPSLPCLATSMPGKGRPHRSTRMTLPLPRYENLGQDRKRGAVTSAAVYRQGKRRIITGRRKGPKGPHGRKRPRRLPSTLCAI